MDDSSCRQAFYRSFVCPLTDINNINFTEPLFGCFFFLFVFCFYYLCEIVYLPCVSCECFAKPFPKQPNTLFPLSLSMCANQMMVNRTTEVYRPTSLFNSFFLTISFSSFVLTCFLSITNLSPHSPACQIMYH